MMQIKKEKNIWFENVKDICISCDSKELCIMYAGNFDLYWQIKDRSLGPNDNVSSIEMEITKENYGIYSQFEKLFQNMENINLFDEEIMSEEDKNTFRKYNNAHYNDLFQNNIITWYSDETHTDVANYVKIKRLVDKFVLSFYMQPHIDGYDFDTYHFDSIAIRFRNSGSRYDPFNVLFMKMFNELQKVDDVNDDGHQIHFEEIFYKEQKRLTRQK